MDDGAATPAEQPSENESESEGEDPNASETPLGMIACDEDADCSDRRVCITLTDAGAAAPSGRCAEPSGG